MINDSKNRCGICFEIVHIVRDTLVEFISIRCFDDVVDAAYVFCRENANEIAGVANRFHLIEQREWTDQDIGRLEMLPLHKGAYVFVVPMLIGKHRLDAKDRQKYCNQSKQGTPQSASACYRHDGKQERQENHPAVIRGKAPCQIHKEGYIERTQQKKKALGAEQSAQIVLETGYVCSERDD